MEKMWPNATKTGFLGHTYFLHLHKIILFLECDFRSRESQHLEACIRINEPWHDKTNKMSVHPVWSESSLCAQWEAKDPAFFMPTAKTDQTPFIFPKLWPFENLDILNLSARYLENYWS